MQFATVTEAQRQIVCPSYLLYNTNYISDFVYKTNEGTDNTISITGKHNSRKDVMLEHHSE